MDARRVGRHGARRPFQGAHRHRLPGRRDLPALPREPRLAPPREARVAARHRALPRHHRAVVRAGVARQPGVPAVLLRARALRALPHEGAPARGAVVVLLAHPLRGLPAVDAHARPGGDRRLAARGRRRGVPVAALRAPVDGLRDALLQRLGLEAARLHPARVPRLRPRARRLARARAGARACGSPSPSSPRCSSSSSRWRGATPERARNDWTRELYAAARPWIVAGLAVLAVATGRRRAQAARRAQVGRARRDRRGVAPLHRLRRGRLRAPVAATVGAGRLPGR